MVEENTSESKERTDKAVLVTELVDGERLWDSLDDTAVRVLKLHDRLALGLLERFGGSEVEKGRVLASLFARAIDAVGYALAYHDALEDLSQNLGRILGSRAAIHLGEISEPEASPDDGEAEAPPHESPHGAQHVATRIMALARPGQTLLTREAFDQARREAENKIDEKEVRWVEHGAYNVPGFGEAIELFEVGRVETAPFQPPAGEKVPSAEPSRLSRHLARSRWQVAALVLVLLGLAAAVLLWLL